MYTSGQGVSQNKEKLTRKKDNICTLNFSPLSPLQM